MTPTLDYFLEARDRALGVIADAEKLLKRMSAREALDTTGEDNYIVALGLTALVAREQLTLKDLDKRCADGLKAQGNL